MDFFSNYPSNYRQFRHQIILNTCVAVVSTMALLVGSFSWSQEEPQVQHLESLGWGPPGGGNGFPVGVQTLRVGVDPVTEGISYYAKFPAQSHFDLHWHTYNEYVVVVSGNVTIVLGDQTHSLSPGSYIVIPGKMNHSWDVPAGEDAVIFVRRSGPADFHFVD